MKRFMISRVVAIVLLMAWLPYHGTAQLNTFDVVQNLEWAKPKGYSLTMDIYTPQTGKASYPVFVIFHGGGWLINNETIMDQMSVYMVEHAEYVVCNVNYRTLPALNNTTTMDEIVGDVFGAVLWIKDHISKYKGDPDRMAVSGDSAGGHLAAMVVGLGHRLESDGYGGATLGFRPTYLPKGMTAEEVAAVNGLQVQAAVLNYPATDLYQACLGNFETAQNGFWSFAQAAPRGLFGPGKNVNDNPELYKTVSPMLNIAQATERKYPPMLCTVGSNDALTTPASVKAFADALQQAGQPVEYWVHEGRPHAFLDSGSNQFLGIAFEKDAPPAIDKIISFLDGVFYP
ncbi:MAG: alpha/beta hydrolase [Cyclobacteriaceae bacterium]